MSNVGRMHRKSATVHNGLQTQSPVTSSSKKSCVNVKIERMLVEESFLRVDQDMALR